ncbi:MAG: hypothetical protein ACSHYF_08725 [Verrucomicrobiaceae bacterium]
MNVTTFRQELKVLAVLAFFLVGLELYSIKIAPTLDTDRAHIHDIPTLTASLPPENGTLFLGNSLMKHGLDPDLLAAQRPDLPFIKISPVATAALDWEHLHQRYLQSNPPDRLVLGFVAHHLNDSEPVKLRRLARHFATANSLPSLWQNENLNFHQRTQSLLAHTTALIGDQPAHRERILDYFIDWYRLGLRTNQDWVTPKITTSSRSATFQRITRFLDACQANGTQVILVPMPQPEPWPLDPQIPQLIKKYKLTLLDARSLPTITPDDFSDGYHLGESGSKKFTHWLAQTLP